MMPWAFARDYPSRFTAKAGAESSPQNDDGPGGGDTGAVEKRSGEDRFAEVGKAGR